MTKTRLTKTGWADLGLAQLSTHGVEAVKLDAICKAAGVTKGSFYHHFKDHAAFLVTLIERWVETQTTQVTADVDTAQSSGKQMSELTSAVMNIDYRLELAIRDLARRVPQIAHIVSAADETRITVLADLYAARFDLSPESARRHATLEYAVFNGIILLNPTIGKAEQQDLAEFYDTTISAALAHQTR